MKGESKTHDAYINNLNEDATVDFTTQTYGHHFNEDAKLRMVQGSRHLLGYINEFAPSSTGTMLELGPHLAPLLSPTSLTNPILFIDADEQIVKSLNIKYLEYDRVRVLRQNLATSSRFHEAEIKYLLNMNGWPDIDFCITSQLLNYIDYERLFETITRITSRKAYLLVNNVIDYGIPELFSDDRPKSNQDIIDCLESLGWVIQKYQLISSANSEQANSRLIMSAKKK
jgi:hypothetical protein